MNLKEKKDLCIEASFDHEAGKVRVQWEVKNISKRGVQLLGYWCSFFKGIDEMGVWIQQKSTWAKEKHFISKGRVRTFLNPLERRSFVWAWVVPQYYGISETGEWSFEVSILYSFENEQRLMVESYRSNSIKINSFSERDSNYFDERTIKTLQKRFPNIRSIDGDTDLSTVLYLQQPSEVVDAILRDDRSLILVELKTYVNPEVIERLENARKSVLESYGSQTGLDVIVALVVPSRNNVTVSHISEYIHILSLEND